MNQQEAAESAALDQAWREAEPFARIFIDLGAGHIPFDAPGAAILIRKACSLAGLECYRKVRERAEPSTSEEGAP